MTKKFNRLCCLICLQMANHVPFGIMQLSKLGGLATEFLHLALAENPGSCGIGFSDGICREGLADCHEGNLPFRTPNTSSCGGDLLSNLGDVFGNGHKKSLN